MIRGESSGRVGDRVYWPARKVAGGTLALTSLIGGLSGCGGDERAERQAAAEAYEASDSEFVPAPELIHKTDNALNEWLGENPNKRIVSIAGILAFRDNLEGFQIISEPGSNEGQACEWVEYSGSNYLEGDGPGAFGSPEIQVWLDEHPDRELVAHTSVPRYGGGVRGYVLCWTPKLTNTE